jgi:aminopeptidase N
MAPADSWEDWLNEGFAEYSALLVIKEMFGDQALRKWIEGKKIAIKDTPPIWGFDRNNMNAAGGPDIIEANLYSKGPVLLQLLSERIGDEKFRALCKKMIKSSTSSTVDFLTLLENIQGNEVRSWFEDLLKSY